MVGKRDSRLASRSVGSPRQADKLLEKGKSLLKRRQFGEAAKTLRHAVRETPENPKVLRAYAEALSRSNHHTQAVEYFERAETLDPSDGSRQSAYAKSLSMQASDLGRLGQYTDALPLYEKALDLDPINLNTLQNYAMTVQRLAQDLSHRHRHQEAITVLSRALEYKPHDHRLQTACANAAVAVGHLELAYDLLDQCLAQQGDDFWSD